MRHAIVLKITILLRQAQAESSSKLARGSTDDAGGGDAGTVASAGRAPQVMVLRLRRGSRGQVVRWHDRGFGVDPNPNPQAVRSVSKSFEVSGQISTRKRAPLEGSYR